jgi:hypothetical protein
MLTYFERSGCGTANNYFQIFQYIWVFEVIPDFYYVPLLAESIDNPRVLKCCKISKRCLMRAIIVALLLCSPALAQEGEQLPRAKPPQRVWITEFETVRLEAAAPFAQLPALVKHPPLDLTNGAAKQATLHPNTRYFRIICEVQCAVSTTGVATTDDILIPRLIPEYFGIAGEKMVSVIAAP